MFNEKELQIVGGTDLLKFLPGSREKVKISGSLGLGNIQNKQNTQIRDLPKY